jgi:hypothetical protein
MNILSIDPGDHVGVCFKNSCSIELHTFTDYDVLFNYVSDIIQNVDIVIIERPPKGLNVSFFNEIKYWAKDKEIVLISPGEWKPVAKKRKWRCPDKKDRHAHDAWKMMIFYEFKNCGMYQF